MPQGLRRLLLVALLLLALDQATKLWVVVWLDLAGRLAIDVVPPFLNLRMAWNRGVNFGLLASGAETARWLLAGLAVAISAGLCLWLRNAAGWRAPLLAGLVVGGAIGNALDRVVWGAVADFLNMSCCGIDNPFSFNVADIAIFAGALGLVAFGTGPNSGRDAGARTG